MDKPHHAELDPYQTIFDATQLEYEASFKPLCEKYTNLATRLLEASNEYATSLTIVTKIKTINNPDNQSELHTAQSHSGKSKLKLDAALKELQEYVSKVWSAIDPTTSQHQDEVQAKFVQSLRNDITRLTNLVAQLQKTAQDRGELIEGLNNEILAQKKLQEEFNATAQRQQDELKAAHQKQQDELKAGNKKKKNQRKAAALQKVDELKAANKLKQDELNAIHDKKQDELQVEIAKRDVELAQFKASIGSLRGEWQSLVDEQKTKIETLQQQYKDLINVNAASVNTIKTLTNDKDTQARTIASQANTIATHETTIKTLADEKVTQAKTITRLKQDNKLQSKKTQLKEKTISRLHQEIIDLEATKSQLQTANKTLTRELAGLTPTLSVAEQIKVVRDLSAHLQLILVKDFTSDNPQKNVRFAQALAQQLECVLSKLIGQQSISRVEKNQLSAGLPLVLHLLDALHLAAESKSEVVYARQTTVRLQRTLHGCPLTSWEECRASFWNSVGPGYVVGRERTATIQQKISAKLENALPLLKQTGLDASQMSAIDALINDAKNLSFWHLCNW